MLRRMQHQIPYKDAELLARLLGGPRHTRLERALQVLQQVGGLGSMRLSHRNAALVGCGLSCQELRRLQACVELAHRMMRPEPTVRPISGPEEAYEQLYALLGDDIQESFAVLVLDGRNCLRHGAVIARGGLDSCPVDPRVVFLLALKHAGRSIIVGHNHPSGNPAPSREDIALTYRLMEAGKILSISVLDHLILGRQDAHPPGYISMAQENLLNFPVSKNEVA